MVITMSTKSIKAKVKPVCVVLDSNIWRSSHLLKTPIGAALIFSVKQSNGVIGLPEVVENEVMKQIGRMGNEAIENVNKNFRTIEILLGSRPDYTIPTDSDLQTSVTNRFAELDNLLKRVPFTLNHAKAAMERVNSELPPKRAFEYAVSLSAIVFPKL